MWLGLCVHVCKCVRAFKSIECRHECARGRCTLAHALSFTFTVCTAGFIFSTWHLYNQGDTGGNKRKAKNISCISFTLYLMLSLSGFHRLHVPSFAFYLSSPKFLCFSTTLSFPQCFLPHYIFDSWMFSSLFAASLLMHFCPFPTTLVCLTPPLFFVAPPSPFATTLFNHGSEREGKDKRRGQRNRKQV